MSRPVVCRPGGVSTSLKLAGAAAGQGNLAAAAEELVSPSSLRIHGLCRFSHVHLDASTRQYLACKALLYPGKLWLPLVQI